MDCPSCRRSLQPCGEVDVDGETLAVYQCDHCTRSWEFDGETFQTALTFAVDAGGRLIDPESLEPIHLN